MFCHLIAHSDSPHLNQIYTGFSMLRMKKLIDMRQTIVKGKIVDETMPYYLQNAQHAHLRVILNEQINLFYDTHDSWEVDETCLDLADYYFKRSYSPSKLEYLGERAKKIVPLGLNYQVYPDCIDRFALERCLLELDFRKNLYKIALSAKLPMFIPKVSVMEAPPDYKAEPRVLFMVQAWDLYDQSERTKEKIEEREQINQTRATTLRLLKKEFGNRFYGGFVHTDFAVKNFPDLLIPEKGKALKKNYIKHLQQFPICIATTGLHGSTGWKFAEYIAFSKAIVSEKLQYRAAGNLEDGRNYLSFNTPEKCVEHALTLVSNAEIRTEMMNNNYRYYQLHLRPDSIVFNSLLTAMMRSKQATPNNNLLVKTLDAY